ncbi:MAG: hypothetical protein HW413_2018 [Thermoleophilia bacterium]|nr:hypothetical protein [Thermoleophilia bacterium]
MGQNRIPLTVSLLVPQIAKLSLILATLAISFAALLDVLVAGRGEASAVEREAIGKAKPVVLAFGADVHFEGILETKLAANPSGVLAPIGQVLDDADLAVVTLETDVTDSGAAATKQFAFSAR